MKRIHKLMLLSAAAALCLLLTGCYNEDPTSTGTSASGSYTEYKPPFEVNTSPEPTVVVVEPDATATGTQQGTQVITVTGNPAQQNPAAQATTPPPTGSDNAWDLWTPQAYQPGVPIQLPGTSPSVQPGATISLITETPPPGTPTPAPVTTPPFTEAPKSLQKGFTGSQAVRQVQQRLKDLGYYKGSVDGDFGAKTEEAVKDFQKANKLTVDGKVGENTLKKLNSKDAVTYKQAHATPTPRPTPTPKPTPTPTPKPTKTPDLSKDYYLTLGSTGKNVETLQKRLIELGWLSGKATGTYDAATEQAVRAFQKKASGLYEDGIAGPDTLKAVYSSGAPKTSSAAADTGETLEFGSEGSRVRTLQQKLKSLGYLAGTVDGKYGVETQAAVISFQRNNGLTADGKAGSATLTKLYSGNVKKATGNAPKIDTSEKKKSGQDTSNIASTGFETLENGSEGTQVRKLQERLKQLNYYTGSVDGSFGDATEAAVMAFQQVNNLTVDGKAGPATQRVLYGTGKQSPSMYTSLQRGDSGERVRNLQYTLYELGYYDGSIDGDYGQTTEDAVKAFQIRNSVEPVDGIAGKVTMSVLYSSDAKAATTPEDFESVGPGATGEIVQEIQDCLIERQYMTNDQRSSTYDDITTAAVRQFQQDNNMQVDGICGKQTLELLFGSIQLD